MRKTLHSLPPDLALQAHWATVHFRERDARRSLVRNGVGADVVAAVEEALTRVLAGGPLPYRDIEALVPRNEKILVDSFGL